MQPTRRPYVLGAASSACVYIEEPQVGQNACALRLPLAPTLKYTVGLPRIRRKVSAMAGTDTRYALPVSS